MKKQSYLSRIPKVNNLLESKKGQRLLKIYSHRPLVDAIREVLDDLRNTILEKGEEELELNPIEVSETVILQKVEKYLKYKFSPNLKPVVNATGVVIHTNLGRSLLSNSARRALEKIAVNYSSLEIDRESGERGSRYDNVSGILQELTGAEDSMVLNNNAGAVLLVLSSMANNKEVIIARGELVEIGGSFRIPDVMKMSGAGLVEVGTTNKVYISDYKEAITPDTSLLLKVHTSNYRIVGFTEKIELEELVKLGEQESLPVMVDLGSGMLVDLTKDGLSYEPTVQENIAAGADIVTFSGDKLLGGPQAGIIVGKKDCIAKMKKHPLNRALRVDKFTLAALEATLKEYLDKNNARREIPTLKMLTTTPEELKKKGEVLFARLNNEIKENLSFKIKKDVSCVGGGAYPGEKLPTYVIEIEHDELSDDKLARRLRMNNPPIFSRIKNNKVLFDMRTLKDNDLGLLVSGLKKLNISDSENV